MSLLCNSPKCLLSSITSIAKRMVVKYVHFQYFFFLKHFFGIGEKKPHFLFYMFSIPPDFWRSYFPKLQIEKFTFFAWFIWFIFEHISILFSHKIPFSNKKTIVLINENKDILTKSCYFSNFCENFLVLYFLLGIVLRRSTIFFIDIANNLKMIIKLLP